MHKHILLIMIVVILYGCGGSSNPAPIVEDPVVEPAPIIIAPIPAPDPIIEEPVEPEPIIELTEQEEWLNLVNDFRANGSCSEPGLFFEGKVSENARLRTPFRWDDRLGEAARLHSEDMAVHNFFSHTGSDGSHFTTRASQQGYSMWGGAENIAAGNTEFLRTMRQWAFSPGHCANMMGSYSDIGIGYHIDSGSDWGVYWTMKLGS